MWATNLGYEASERLSVKHSDRLVTSFRYLLCLSKLLLSWAAVAFAYGLKAANKVAGIVSFHQIGSEDVEACMKLDEA